MKRELIETYTELGKRLNKTFEKLEDLEFKINEVKKILKDYENDIVMTTDEVISKIKEILEEE